MRTAGLAFPKPRPAKLARAERRKQQMATDDAQNRVVRQRSGGRCEVIEEVMGGLQRCDHVAIHVHHLLSGIGVRGRGRSAMAENKLHCCLRCHDAIHAHTLIPEGGYFRRIR